MTSEKHRVPAVGEPTVADAERGVGVVSGRRSAAFLEVILVVSIWSLTPPLAKIAMVYISPFEFLGARYALAFLALLPLLLRRTRSTLRHLPAGAWVRLVLMGVLAYPIANGLQFWALARLSATTGTFTMNFVPLFALALGILWLAERPTRLQGVGFAVALLGALLFFGLDIAAADLLPIVASTFGSLVLAVNVVMARAFARSGQIDSVGLAAIPLGVGGGLLLLFAPPPVMPLPVLAIIVFLAIVGGALAYTVWNHALKGLQAFEITLVGNLMPMGTALAAPLLLGEVVTPRMWLGMLIALVGVVLVGTRPDFRQRRAA